MQTILRCGTRSVASNCDRVGIANWILVEYPIWAGLEHAGWNGTIEHVERARTRAAVSRTTSSSRAPFFEKSATDYVPEDTDRVELRYGILSLSISTARPPGPDHRLPVTRSVRSRIGHLPALAGPGCDGQGLTSGACPRATPTSPG